MTENKFEKAWGDLQYEFAKIIGAIWIISKCKYLKFKPWVQYRFDKDNGLKPDEMSTKSTILLSDDNEHWYFDCQNNPDAIILEFNKDNIDLYGDDLTITIEILPDTDLYKQAQRSLLKGAWFNNSWK